MKGWIEVEIYRADGSLEKQSMPVSEIRRVIEKPDGRAALVLREPDRNWLVNTRHKYAEIMKLVAEAD